MRTAILAAWVAGSIGFAQDGEAKKKEILEKVKARLDESRPELLKRVGRIIEGELSGKTGTQDNGAKKKEILDKVRARLDETRQALLKKVGQIIDDELAGKTEVKPVEPKAGTPAERVKSLEERLKKLKDEENKIRSELLMLRWGVKDEKLYGEVRKSGLEPEEAQDLFREGMDAHNDKDFKTSIPAFKRIAYAFYDHDNKQLVNFGCISAYNVACGYSLDGKKAEALEWLEISINLGYFNHPDQCHENALEHMEKDADFDNIRDEPLYKEFVKRGKSK
jgi:hypothetical protein